MSAKDLDPNSIVRIETVPLTNERIIFVRCADNTWKPIAQFAQGENPVEFMRSLSAFAFLCYGLGATDAADKITLANQLIETREGKRLNIAMLENVFKYFTDTSALVTKDEVLMLRSFIDAYKLTLGVTQ